MAKQSEEEARIKAAEEKKRREAKDLRDKEESSKVFFLLFKFFSQIFY